MAKTTEPNYEGHPLHYWLRSDGGVVQVVSGVVVHPDKLDSNAVPFLISTLNESERFWEQPYEQFFSNCPTFIGKHLPAPKPLVNAKIRAILFLRALGEAAKPAVPSLVRTLQNNKDSFVRANSALALGYIGDSSPPVISALRASLSQTNSNLGSCADLALQKLDYRGN